jgi:hypothetical protein
MPQGWGAKAITSSAIGKRSICSSPSEANTLCFGFLRPNKPQSNLKTSAAVLSWAQTLLAQISCDFNIWFGKTGRAIVSVKAGDTVGVSMIRDLRGTIEREGAEIGILLSLTPPKKTMIAEAAAAGQHELDGFAPVPRLQIVTIEDALALRDRAVQLPARRDDAFKRAAKEDDPGAQGSLGL